MKNRSDFSSFPQYFVTSVDSMLKQGPDLHFEISVIRDKWSRDNKSRLYFSPWKDMWRYQEMPYSRTQYSQNTKKRRDTEQTLTKRQIWRHGRPKTKTTWNRGTTLELSVEILGVGKGLESVLLARNLVLHSDAAPNWSVRICALLLNSETSQRNSYNYKIVMKQNKGLYLTRGWGRRS